ncbi:type II secretion system protein GspD [Methylovorus menthalis]|uniref:secretin N-terminal domain-containing protein n=1 Tax=Methylovorus menthalis TaxID=1002227 RepID=UPI001E5B3B7B|nr:secretin N-terminal domain-containing protein [Methylovorus menthalis]MCB4812084.1 type II secretion system protein GspD [Methylovorus menthalis]
MKSIPLTTLCSLLLLSELSACAFAPWPKSDVKGDTPEARVSSAQENLHAKPESAIPRKDLFITQEQAVKELLAEAEKQRTAGHFIEANALYDRVITLAPNNVRAIAGKASITREYAHSKRLDQARAMLDNHNSEAAWSILRTILMENPDNKEALQLQASIRASRDVAQSEPPRLKPPFQKPVSLEFRDANIKMVFEALSRATGINFILDKDIRADAKATVYIRKASIEDAIEMVLATNGLQKKALTETSALIFPNTPQKVKDYKELMIRSFYLTNASAKQVASTLKTVLKTKDVVVDERLNMIVMRDTPEVIHIAEKLVAANDLADPEVMLEIEVLEISRSRLQELGIAYPNQISVNSRIPVTTSTAGSGIAVSSTVATDAPLTLEGLLNLNSSRFDVSPNPSVNFRKTTGDVNLISNPRIRVRNNEKAKILVGDKVPIITTTSTANVGISENVTYIDVGLKLDVEPRITLDDFVNIKIGLEVSSLGDRTTTRNGATVYTIGTRNASTLLRLKDGEMQILAGLILDDERKNASKLPALGDIPILGRLFSNQEDRKNKTEIVLAITPRILGNISRPDAEISEYWSGTESGISDKPQIAAPTANSSPTVSAATVESAVEAPSAADANGVSAEDAVITPPAANTNPPAPAATSPVPAPPPAVEGVDLSR